MEKDTLNKVLVKILLKTKGRQTCHFAKLVFAKAALIKCREK